MKPAELSPRNLTSPTSLTAVSLSCSVTRLSLILLFCVMPHQLAANNQHHNRVALNGLIDSDGNRDYWEDRTRVSYNGVVVTSETYVLASLFEDGVERPGDVIEIHRVELIGNISSAEYRTLQQIARAGNAGSLHQLQVARRFGLDGVISSASAEIYDRYGLSGIITSENNHLELAVLRREDGLQIPQEPRSSDPVADADLPVFADSPSFWTRSRALIGTIEPSLTSYLRVDNIDRTVTGAQDSSVVVVRPHLRFALQQPRWTFLGDYELESGRYFKGDEDGFNNHELRANWGYRPSKDNQFNVAATYRNWHDRRTRQAIEDFNAGLLGSFDHDSLGFDFTYQRGTNEDKRRFEVVARTEHTDVDSKSAIQDFGYGLQNNSLTATHYWRVKRRVTVLLEGQYQNFNYASRSDSIQYRLLPGVEFWLPRRITGTVLLGYERKEHQDLNLSFSSPVWRADLSWRLKKRSTLELQSARELLEVFAQPGAINSGEFGVQQYGRLSWAQRWNQAWKSDLSFTYQERDFEGTDRVEQTSQWVFGTTFRAGPRLTFRGDGAFTSQQVQGQQDFDRWTLTVQASMGL